MHRTKNANSAIRTSTSIYTALKSSNSSKAQLISNKSSDKSKDDNENYVNILAQKNIIGITNVHQLISNQKLMSSKKNKKKASTQNEKAPENALTPPSTPSSPLTVNDNFEFLMESWNQFTNKKNGEKDESILVYKSTKSIPENFEPFNIDRFLAEQLLKELDIDPKYAIF